MQENSDYLQSSEKLALKWSIPGRNVNFENSQSRDLKSCAVIGGGVMGQGIAASFLCAGFKLVVLEMDDETLKSCRDHFESLCCRRGFESEFRQKLNDGNLVFTTDFHVLQKIDLIVEAVYEDLVLKCQIFEKLCQICSKNTILATNTSTLSIDKIAANINRPENVIGMHFFNPADRNRLVEIIHGSKTSGNVVASAFKVTQKINKIPVLVGNCAGFCGNRMLRHYMDQAIRLAEECGLLPRQIDSILERFGFLAGPFRVLDLIGLNTFERIAKENEWWTSRASIAELVRGGKFGRTTNEGWYLYADGHRQENPVSTELIRQLSSKNPHKFQLQSEQDLLEFILLPLVNEGLKILEEKIVWRPSDVDLIWVYGLGWPVGQGGGPMRWASQTYTRKELLSRLRTFGNIDWRADCWKPASSLLEENSKL